MIVNLGDGRRTTVHFAEYALDRFELSVVRLPKSVPLLTWCRSEGVEEALVGGFYLREPQRPSDPTLSGMPLGDLRTGGRALATVPFDEPWGSRRACVSSAGGVIRIARRDDLPANPAGDLLQAGPLLVSGGLAVEDEYEGFSEGSSQFDSDITEGRHPRAALGLREGMLVAVVCEGRTPEQAGLTIAELAEVMIGLGVTEALNLDGGGSTSLVTEGGLRNTPREGDGTPIPGGRPVSTALTFIPM